MEDKKYYSIGEAAQIAHTTSETLRHYDRIGLVRPSMKDEWTNYRYYTKQDIVRINTVSALKLMDIPLKEIKKVLEYDDLEKIIEFLNRAEKKAKEKIERLNKSIKKIEAAKSDYERKLKWKQPSGGLYIKRIESRAILLSDAMEKPTLDNLWNYLGHFYNQIPSDIRDEFSFEDLAGIYTEKERTRLFALCNRFKEIKGLKILPEGDYLCLDCKEDEMENAIEKLLETAKDKYKREPEFIIQLIILKGMLQWDYQIQVYIGR